MTLSDREWIELLSGDYGPSPERVIFVGRSGRSLRIPKDVWNRYFSGFGGIDFKPGNEVEIVPAGNGGARAQLPKWVIERLALNGNGGLCITHREGTCYLKRLRLTERTTRIPGTIVIDRLGSPMSPGSCGP